MDVSSLQRKFQTYFLDETEKWDKRDNSLVFRINLFGR